MTHVPELLDRSPPANMGAAEDGPRERLLHAARKLFCQYGINSTGVDRIVDRAGAAKTTL
jgi:AcrR family transcriptional regulator